MNELSPEPILLIRKRAVLPPPVPQSPRREGGWVGGGRGVGARAPQNQTHRPDLRDIRAESAYQQRRRVSDTEQLKPSKQSVESRETRGVAGRTRACGSSPRPRPEKRSGAERRGAGELLITAALRSLSRSVSKQGGSWRFRGIKYGLRVNRGRRGLEALTGYSAGAARGRQRGGEGERRGGGGGRLGEMILEEITYFYL